MLQLEQEAVGVRLEVVCPRLDEEAAPDPPLEDDGVQVHGLPVLPPQQPRPGALAEVVWLGARGPEVKLLFINLDFLLNRHSQTGDLGKVHTSNSLMLNQHRQ